MAPLPLEECQALMLAPGAPKVDKVGRSRTLRICSCGRPWFRAFHFSWMAFFLSFLGWFAFAPVLNYLAEDPSIMATPSEIANSNIISVLGTILVRLILGPLCEKYGSRKLMTIVLVYGSICVALSSLVNSVAGLYAARFFISFVGGAFIMCQYWTTVMFSKEVVGTANATAGGWGNLGGGVSALLIGGLLDAFGPQGANYPDNLAWRYAMLVPAALMFMITIPMYVLTDDCPYGDWSNKQYNGHTSHDSEAGSAGFDPSDVEISTHNGNMTSIPETSMHAPVPKPKTDKELEEMAQSDINKAIQMGKTTETDVKKAKVEGENIPEEKGRWLPLGFDDWRVWVLAIQYGLCFGVEVAITNVIPIYLYNGFKKSGCVEDTKTAVLECAYYNKSMAALVGSLFGMTNIFARASGGYMSDKLFAKIGMRGRLITLFVVNIFQGIFVIVFSQLHDPQAATAILVIFAMFVQMGAGATYGIVPFVNSKAVGPVSGVVGAGGNIGAVTWTAMFKAAPNMRTGFLWLGIVVICGTFTLLPVPVKGVTLLCGGKEEKYDDDAISSNKADPIKGYAVAEPSNHTKQPPLADPSAPSEVNNKVANV